MPLDEPIIDVIDLKKIYKTHERKEGFLEAIKSIYKRKYKKKVALKGVSFEVQKGEILGLIGPNGAGKSTIIKSLCGILYPTSGEVRSLNYTPWLDRVEYVKNIGVIFGQKSLLWWDLPPLDTYSLLQVIYKIPEKDFRRRLNKMVSLLSVKDVVKQPTRDLSLGERMKCELIAALLHNPSIVFLDEPTIGVDIVAKDRIRKLILETNKKYGTTFIVTTHDMGDIEKLCERVIIINYGDIVYDGLLNRLQSKFVTTKIIDLKLKKPQRIRKLKGVDITKINSYEYKLEVDIKKQKIDKLVSNLLSKYQIADLAVTNVNIEEVIKEIYQK
jgi:ABC-2 type transport system ATP-binding protein